jgi:hypothetical protein
VRGGIKVTATVDHRDYSGFVSHLLEAVTSMGWLVTSDFCQMNYFKHLYHGWLEQHSTVDADLTCTRAKMEREGTSFRFVVRFETTDRDCATLFQQTYGVK